MTGPPSSTGEQRDARAEVAVVLRPGSCAVEFGGPASGASAIRMGDMWFVFDEGRVLRRVQVTGLSGDQMEVLAAFAAPVGCP